MGVEQSRRKTVAVFLALTLLALLIRLAWLDRKSLVLDEVYSLNRASSDVLQIIQTRGDSHPPFYYLALHYWIEFGESEFALRLPSALFGAVSVGLVYLLGRRWRNEWIGVTSGALLAVAPLPVWLSQEARMYPAASAFGLISVFALSEGMKTGRWFAWAIWVAATVLGLYTHYLIVLLFLLELAVLLVAGVREPGFRHRALPAALAIACILLLYGPWLPRLVYDGGTLAAVLRAVYIAPAARIEASGGGIGEQQALVVLIAAGTFGLAALIWSSQRLGKWRPSRPSWSTSAIIAGASLLYGVALVGSVWPVGYSIRRQILIFFPYFLLMMAWGVSRARQRNWLAGGMVLIALPFLVATLTLVEQQGWRPLAAFVTEQASQQDVILFSAPYYAQDLEYYYHGPIPSVGVTPGDVPDQIARLTQDRARVWLVLCGGIYTDPQGKIPSWLDKQRGLINQYTFPAIDVRLYGPPRSGVSE